MERECKHCGGWKGIETCPHCKQAFCRDCTNLESFTGDCSACKITICKQCKDGGCKATSTSQTSVALSTVSCKICKAPRPSKLCGVCGIGDLCCKRLCDEACDNCSRPQSSSNSNTKPVEKGSTGQVLSLKECTRKKDVTQALDLYKLFGITQHDAGCLVLDVLIGNFENVGIKGAIPVNESTCGDFRHLAHCDSCTRPVSWKHWCVHPVELWKLRGTVTIWALAQQIEALQSKRSQLLGAVPDCVAGMIEKRLDHLLDVAARAKLLQIDGWEETYAAGLLCHTIGLRHAGISDWLPRKIEIVGLSELIDADSKQRFGGFRGSDHPSKRGSLTAQVAKYMDSVGGCFDDLSSWMGDQAGNSWKNDACKRMKIFWLTQRRNALPSTQYKEAVFFELLQTNPSKATSCLENKSYSQLPYAFYWPDGCFETACMGYFNQLENARLKLAVNWQVWHAFSWEILSKTIFFNNDRANCTMRLIRTEAAIFLTNNKVDTQSSESKGVVLQPGTRGPCESASAFALVSVGGNRVTIQSVPHHRVVALYFAERTPGSNTCCLKQDDENEFLFLTQGVGFDYSSQAPKPKEFE